MGVTGQGQIFGRGPEFHRHANLVDQIAGCRADDVRPKDTIRVRICQNFDKAVACEIRLGPAVAHKAELANLIGCASFFQGLFGDADIGDLGVGVDHTGDNTVVHVPMFARNRVGHGHAFVFGLVGQHRTFDHVTNGVDAGDVSLPVGVDGDLTAFGHFHTQRIEPEPVGKGFAPCGYQNNVGVHGVFAVILAQFIGDFGFCLGRLDALYGGPHGKGQALFHQ